MDEIANRPRKIPINMNELMKDIKELDIDLNFPDEEVQENSQFTKDNIEGKSTNNSVELIDDDAVDPIITDESMFETLTSPLTLNSHITRPPRDFSQYNNDTLINAYDGNNSSDDDGEEETTDNDHDDDEEEENVDEQNFNPYVALNDDADILFNDNNNNTGEEEFSDFMESSTSIISSSNTILNENILSESNLSTSLSDKNIEHIGKQNIKLQNNDNNNDDVISLQKLEDNLFTQDFENQIDMVTHVTTRTANHDHLKTPTFSIAPLSKDKINLIKSTMLGIKISPRPISDMAFNNLDLSSIRLGDELI